MRRNLTGAAIGAVALVVLASAPTAVAGIGVGGIEMGRVTRTGTPAAIRHEPGGATLQLAGVQLATRSGKAGRSDGRGAAPGATLVLHAATAGNPDDTATVP